VMMMRLTADDVQPQSLPAGIVPRRGTMALSTADTCKQGRQANGARSLRVYAYGI